MSICGQPRAGKPKDLVTDHVLGFHFRVVREWRVLAPVLLSSFHLLNQVRFDINESDRAANGFCYW